MAFVVKLIEGSEPDIDLFYSATDEWAMLDKGFLPNDPERRELWGGYLETILVRQEDGKRTIPLELQGTWTTPDDLIDAVNALEERLRHAARYRIDGWGDEVFLRFQLSGATYGVDFPACSGQINKADLMNACNLMMESGHRVAKSIKIGLTLICEPYWDATETYTFENYIDNPGWWRWAAAPGDSWTEVNAPDLTSTQDTTIWQVMGNSLKQVYVVDAVNDTGVISDAQTVVASTAYYFQVRNYRVTGCDTLTAQVYDISNGAIIAASVLTFNGAVDEWVTQGVSFTTPVGCVSIRVELLCLAGDSVAGGTAYWDAVYLTPGTTAPVGWSSGRNLTNELDAADQINVLCVTEIPGEVEAEIKATLTLDDDTSTMRVAKRTRDEPHNFIWQLLGVNAVVTAGDAACIDSALVGDATAPGGQRVTVTFAGTQTMALRCYWDITADLTSYFGKFVLLVIAKMSGTTDMASIKIDEYDETASMIGATKVVVSGTTWTLYDGWEVLGFRIGTHDNDLFGAGNNWRISLQASTDGIPTDELHIACAFLVPIDEAYLATAAGALFAGGQSQMILKEMDGDRGMFAYGSGTDTYYPNLGGIGTYPLLTPEVENWLYFVSGGGYVLTDAFHVALQYRPRGIFLRGSNP